MQVQPLSLDLLSAQVRSMLDRGEITQDALAKRAKVDQGLISRLKNNKLRRVTPRIKRIWKYVNSRVSMPPSPDHLTTSLNAYLVAGGDPEVLSRQINLLRDILDNSAKT
jgi:predicted transcriptional regulator